MTLRLATYNVEWFNALFDDIGFLLEDNEPSARHQITRSAQITALGVVFNALNADGVMIIEGPDQGTERSSVRALENFAMRFALRARKAVHGYTSDTAQEIVFLYDPDVLAVTLVPRGSPATEPGELGGASDAPRFDTSRFDTSRQTIPGGAATYMAQGQGPSTRFSKPPLELAVTWGQKSLRLIGVHAKSKAAHGRLSQDEFIKVSLENRRKQLAECAWIRARAVADLKSDHSVLIMGDFNDGPGLDTYESVFGKSGIEIVLGLDAPQNQQFYDPHAASALDRKPRITPTTARFWLAPQQRFFQALLDFIMVSPDVAKTKPIWRIWHPLNDPQMTPHLQNALLVASDHFPVTIELNWD
jgi:endonuclease/exonuclease/phosphatase family metal-dependent hydrolase